MTEHQQTVFDAFKRGCKLDWQISGFYFKHRLLRVETVDALIATGELALIQVEGKFVFSEFVVHESQIDSISAGRKVLRITVPFSYDAEAK